jgi:hypothetical protein
MTEARDDRTKNPFVGPRPFELGEQLYGRDREARKLVDLLLAERIVLLHSPSGAGKTSLIQAALVPALAKARFEVLPLVRVNARPPAAPEPPEERTNRYVYSTILSLEAAGSGQARDPVRFARLPLPLVAYLKARARTAQPSPREGARPRLLIFDQFEEVLTADPTDLKDKEVFFTRLGEALQDERLWALFAMREDYVAALEPYVRRLPRQLRATFRLDLLDAEAARRAMQGPAGALGVTFEEEAATRLVNDLRRIYVQGPDSTRTERPGPHVEPVQLQVVCHRLWESVDPLNRPRDPAAAPRIGADDVQAVGDVDTALADYYDRSTRECAQKTGVTERAIRDWFACRLITKQGIRGQVLAEKDQSEGLKNEAIRWLENKHLVRAEERRGATWFELAHDRMIGPVLRSNEQWEKGLSPLQRRAAVWVREAKGNRFLLGDRDLERAERWAARHAGELEEWEQQFLRVCREARAVRVQTNLEDLGWGIIFAPDGADALREALAELLAHRRGQATCRRDSHYKEFKGPDAYRRGETAQEFLARQGIASGFAERDKVPYYLLIVGDPESIPFEFQYGFDAQYAVGRLSFDRAEEYAQYARSVVTCESGSFSLPRRVVVFAPENHDDVATSQALQGLVEPLLGALPKAHPSWKVRAVLREGATKPRLSRIVGGTETPAVLFASGNSVSFPPGDEQQLRRQGGLVCQDWPGVGLIREDHSFSADDVGQDARLLGLMAFFFCSYSAGTPLLDDFPAPGGREPAALALRPFVARLAQRLLANPQGGALAVIGHVERIRPAVSRDREERWAFESGLVWCFTNALERLLKGHTAGSAIEAFRRRYALVSSAAAEELQQVMFRGKARDDLRLAQLMAETIDARNYILLGDPAVRLPVGAARPSAVRPAVAPVVPLRPTAPSTAAAPQPLPAAEPGRPTPSAPSDTDRLIVNGINGATGEYLLPPMTAEQVSRALLGHRPQRTDRAELLKRFERSAGAAF